MTGVVRVTIMVQGKPRDLMIRPVTEHDKRRLLLAFRRITAGLRQFWAGAGGAETAPTGPVLAALDAIDRLMAPFVSSGTDAPVFPPFTPLPENMPTRVRVLAHYAFAERLEIWTQIIEAVGRTTTLVTSTPETVQ